MSERKKIKIQNQIDESTHLLDELKEMTNADSGYLKSKKRFAFDLLKSKDATHASAFTFVINILTEISRLNGTTHTLFTSEDTYDISLFFKGLLVILRNEFFNASEFSKCLGLGLPERLQDEALLQKYLELFPKVFFNKEILRDLLAIFIEYSIHRENHIEAILSKYEKYKELVPRIFKLIDFNQIHEDLYVQIFLDSPFIRENVELREIKGKKRYSYVEKVLSMGDTKTSDGHSNTEFITDKHEFIFNNYIKDRDTRIRLLLAGRDLPEKYFSILLNDPSEDVRSIILSKLNWTPGIEHVADRLLDKCEKVRKSSYEIYKKGLIALKAFKNLNIFDEAVYRNPPRGNLNAFIKMENLNISSDYFGKENNRRNETADNSVTHGDVSFVDSQQASVDQFLIFLRRVCEGCLTGFSSEYIALLNESQFSIDFLCENESLPGMNLFLQTKSISSLDTVPPHQRPCVLRHMFKGTLKHAQIQECIENGIFEALKFISEPKAYYSQLVDKALSMTEYDGLEMIVDFIKPFLKESEVIYKSGTDEMAGDEINNDKMTRDDMMAGDESNGLYNQLSANSSGFVTVPDLSFNKTIPFSSPGLYFLNAHTKTSNTFIPSLLGNDYPSLYFQVHKLKNDTRVLENIKSADISLKQKIKLLLHLNIPEFVQDFAVDLICQEVDFQTRMLVLEAKTVTSALIYFLLTGLVSIARPSFFIKAVKCCLKLKQQKGLEIRKGTNNKRLPIQKLETGKMEDKIKFIFGKYINSLPQGTFNIFYSMCWTLKRCTVSETLGKDELSFVMNPVIYEDNKQMISNNNIGYDNNSNNNIGYDNNSNNLIIGNDNNTTSKNNNTTGNDAPDSYNLNMPADYNGSKQPERPPCGKLILSAEDKMLQTICDVVIGMRPGELTETNFEPTSYGFHRMTDLMCEMVGHGQVVYQ